MPIGSLCFDLLLLYFASKARVRTYFNHRIFPKMLFWKQRRNQVGDISTSRRSSAWGEVARNCAEKFILSSPRGQNKVLQFTAIRGSEEEINKKDSTSNDKDLEDNLNKITDSSVKISVPVHVGQANIAPQLLSQKPVFIRVRTLPGN
jgi:hypothetical protein